jgi:hypothetical protein
MQLTDCDTVLDALPVPSIPAGFLASWRGERGGVRPDLGDLGVIRTLLLELVSSDYAVSVQEEIAGGPQRRADAVTGARIERLANAFLGGDPAFEHVSGWNAPGGIDVHLRREFGLMAGPPAKAVSDVLWAMIANARAAADVQATDPEAAASALRAGVERTARILAKLPADAAGHDAETRN